MLSSQVKFSAERQLDRQTNRKADRRRPIKQYAPDLSMRGHKKQYMNSNHNNEYAALFLSPNLISELMLVREIEDFNHL